MKKEEREEFLQIRKEGFEVWIRKPAVLVGLYPDAVDLSITTNGSQWTSIMLMPDEVTKVIEALQGAIKSE